MWHEKFSHSEKNTIHKGFKNFQKLGLLQSVCKDRQNPNLNTLIFPEDPLDTERIEYQVAWLKGFKFKDYKRGS